ncbi:hypothetical protein Rumeso_02623 [Rubellimicrobium mesophilum DSM 19309]|uniref:Cadherin domain-containing protein n=1 Tax=Rubellimicrobium mesophilum DSM 19309 TaxID=442562 RepID=A0A017HN88_9RHOB|nr:Ig-like domain-containing protein [Rubellimicrobium mesophilum]EYD75841.1 hypothetical protein Rumeso_02623 [Rubellimicrobium mesophilum DSM 19309]
MADTAAQSGRWSSTTGDTIRDFSQSQGDKIDFGDLWKGSGYTPGPYDKLQWRGLAPATPGAYAAWYTHDGTNTFVLADTTGDGVADVAIRALGLITFQATDFLGVNRNPTLVGESIAVQDSSAIFHGSVRTNDTDPEGDSLTYALVGSAPRGLVLRADGSYSFDSWLFGNLAAGQTQTVTATYRASDGHGGSATATLSVKVTGTSFQARVIEGTNDVNVADNLVGTAANETIWGYAGRNTIDAGTGVDRVFGGIHGDSVHFGDLSVGDFADGGSNYGDSFDAVLGASSDTITITDGQPARGYEVLLNGTRVATRFEYFSFGLGGGNDVLDASQVALREVSFAGGAGADTIKVNAYWDSYKGDYYYSTAYIFGGAGNDTLIGSGGSVVINAGTGADRVEMDSNYGSVVFDDLSAGDFAQTSSGRPVS